MNPLWGHFVGIFILLMMALFIGIWIWAWHGSHRPVFSRMAQLPMLDGPGHERPGREWPGYEKPGYEKPGHEWTGYGGCSECGPAKVPARAVSDAEDRP